VCGLPKKHCANDAESLLYAFTPGVDPDYYSMIPEEYYEICGCLPDCTSIMYDAELSQADLVSSKYHKTDKDGASSR
jgi:hypothetical protein